MTNKEKKQYILDYCRLYLKHNPYEKGISIDETITRENAFWLDFSHTQAKALPKTFFKFRMPNEDSLTNLENSKAWFSHPVKFDDPLDSTINNDVTCEAKGLEKRFAKETKEIALIFARIIAKGMGVILQEALIDEIYPVFNKDGSFNKDDAKICLAGKVPENSIDSTVDRLADFVSSLNSETSEKYDSLQDLFGLFSDINHRIKNDKDGVYTFCLAEKDNPAMWAYFADEGKGFCIEYSFPDDNLLGRRMLLNLLPIYYGKRKNIEFLKMLKNGLRSYEDNNSFDFEDYQKCFLSVYTKDKSFGFQNEWRMVFPFGFIDNPYCVPFVKSVILGERMDEEYKSKILNAIGNKEISVFERKLNRTGSKIILKKIK